MPHLCGKKLKLLMARTLLWVLEPHPHQVEIRMYVNLTYLVVMPIPYSVWSLYKILIIANLLISIKLETHGEQIINLKVHLLTELPFGKHQAPTVEHMPNKLG